MAAQRWLVVVLVVTLLLAAIAHASASVDGTLELSIDECARVPDQLYSAKKYVTVKGLDFDEYASQHPLEVTLHPTNTTTTATNTNHCTHSVEHNQHHNRRCCHGCGLVSLCP